MVHNIYIRDTVLYFTGKHYLSQFLCLHKIFTIFGIVFTIVFTTVRPVEGSHCRLLTTRAYVTPPGHCGTPRAQSFKVGRVFLGYESSELFHLSLSGTLYGCVRDAMAPVGESLLLET